MDAFFLIDKPSGITSFGVLRELRKKFQIKKMGHTGTLDPLATGCLLVATGNYTKLIPYLEKDTKEYECSILLDGVSDSYDIDTPVTYISDTQKQKAQNTITTEQIQDIITDRFLGKIIQVPPAYSALKIGGKKAVDLVREGKTPKMKARETTIYENEILNFQYPRLTLRILVSAGTYIRSIAKDLGDILQTGGYIETLTRTKIGNIFLRDSCSLEQVSLDDAFDVIELLGSDNFATIEDETVLQRLSNGQRIRGKFDLPESQDVFIFRENKVQYIVRYEDGLLWSLKKI